MSKKYLVTVVRSGFGTERFTVTADNEKGAKHNAMQAAYNTVFREKSSDYEIEDIQLLETDPETIVKDTLVNVNLQVLRNMISEWENKIGKGTRVHYWLTKLIEEMEDESGSDHP